MKKIKAIIKSKFYKDSALLSIAEMVAKCLGFVRVGLISYYFGASAALDTYHVAIAYPMMIFYVFEATISNTLISWNRSNETNKKVNDISNAVLTFISITSVVIFCLTLLLQQSLAKLSAPGYSGKQLASLSHMIALFSVTIFFRTASGFISARLRIERRFGAVSVQNIAYNISFILGCVLINDITISDLLLITIVSNSVRCFVLIPSIVKHRLARLRNFKFPSLVELGRVAAYMAPIAGSMVANELKSVVDKSIASGLTPGAVSSLEYAYTIIGIPVSIIGNSLAVVAFSYFDGSLTGMNVYKKTMKTLLYILLPCAIFVSLLSDGIVRLIYFRGAFTEENVALTASCLLGYAPSIMFNSMILVMNNFMYCRKQVADVVFLTIGLLISNVVLSIILGKVVGATGIAIATSVSSLLYVVVGSLLIRKRAYVDKDGNKCEQ